jgi:hypothetical protein
MAVGALATSCATWGCVADRPARNGVFNENQYIRKDFLIRSGSTTTAGVAGTDDGWFLKETVVSESIPNPLAAADLSDGITNVNLVRFVVTEDKLNMVNMRELSAGFPSQGARDGEVVDAWPITNVDLKYRVNLDGETTNFYEENQELDWQVRQWVKLNLDKNDLSDLAPLGAFQTFLNQCTDPGNSSTTLVPSSFSVDEPNNYMAWQIQVTVPIMFSDSACVNMYGESGQLFQQFGRNNVTFTVQFSMVRAAPDSGIWTPSRVQADGTLSPTTYPTFSLAEKDPIRKKYGVIENIAWNRDPTTQLLAAQELLWQQPERAARLVLRPGLPRHREDDVDAAGRYHRPDQPGLRGRQGEDSPLGAQLQRPEDARRRRESGAHPVRRRSLQHDPLGLRLRHPELRW